MSDWTIRATIGGTVYTANRADAPGEAELPALYGVHWRHELEDDESGWPRRRAVTSGSVQLLLAEAADAAGFGPEQTVFLEFITGGQTVDWFAGRGSFPVIEPVDKLGVLVTLTVTAYEMDLAALPAGDSDYPEESQAARLNRIMTDYGWAFSIGSFPMTFAARQASATDVLSLLRETLATGAADASPIHLPDSVWRLYELWVDIDPDTGELDPTPYGIIELEPIGLNSLPLKLREHPDEPGTYELWADASDPELSATIVDGACVKMDAQWSRGFRDPNTVYVIKANDAVVKVSEALPGDDERPFSLETTLTSTADAQRLGGAYLPRQQGGEGVSSTWAAEAFTVLLDLTADGWYPPRVADVLDRAQPLRAVMALSDVQRHHHPDGVTYFVGAVTALGLSAAGGTAELTVQLEPHESSPSGEFGSPPRLRIDDVTAPIDSMHPSVTLNAIALARREV